jgi:hypothetical protein
MRGFLERASQKADDSNSQKAPDHSRNFLSRKEFAD